MGRIGRPGVLKLMNYKKIIESFAFKGLFVHDLLVSSQELSMSLERSTTRYSAVNTESVPRMLLLLFSFPEKRNSTFHKKKIWCPEALHLQPGLGFSLTDMVFEFDAPSAFIRPTTRMRRFTTPCAILGTCVPCYAHETRACRQPWRC